MKKFAQFLIVFVSIAIILYFMEIIDLKKIYQTMVGIASPVKKELSIEEKAEKIDAFFAKVNAPVVGYGREFVFASEKYKIDWRLLPAICRQESCGGLFPYNGDPQNILGYKINRDIKSIKEAAELSAKSLSGNGKRTHLLYKDKNLRERLVVYSGNERDYADKVFSFMKEIHSDDKTIR